jgi:hypothetical protein
MGSHGFVYDAGVYETFVVSESVYIDGSEQKTGTFASGINGRGEITGVWWNAAPGLHGFVATPSPRGGHGRKGDEG